MGKKLNLALVGATGAVGNEFLKVLSQRNFPINSIKLLASEKSANKKLNFSGQLLKVNVLDDKSFKEVDLAFFSAGTDTSLEYAKIAVKQGAVVIDNSNAFRMEKDVPLVVPECNAKDALQHNGIIANPNCSTIQMLVCLKPLHDINPIQKINVATYQAVSGTGKVAIDELDAQIKSYAASEPLINKVYPQAILGNAIPQVDVFLEDGYTKEELKMVQETKKILKTDQISISATCVRLPIWRAHSEAIWLEFKHPITKKQAIDCWQKAPGIKLFTQSEQYPTPLQVSGKDEVFIGRIREISDNNKSLCFWCVADQILKGAALNAVQIAEFLIENKKL